MVGQASRMEGSDKSHKPRANDGHYPSSDSESCEENVAARNDSIEAALTTSHVDPLVQREADRVEPKGILKQKGQYTTRKVRVDFNLIPERIPYDETLQCSEILIVDREPVKIKSWAALFAAKKAEAEADAAAAEEAEAALKKAEGAKLRDALKRANKAKNVKTTEKGKSGSPVKVSDLRRGSGPVRSDHVDTQNDKLQEPSSAGSSKAGSIREDSVSSEVSTEENTQSLDVSNSLSSDIPSSVEHSVSHEVSSSDETTHSFDLSGSSEKHNSVENAGVGGAQLAETSSEGIASLLEHPANVRDAEDSDIGEVSTDLSSKETADLPLDGPESLSDVQDSENDSHAGGVSILLSSESETDPVKESGEIPTYLSHKETSDSREESGSLKGAPNNFDTDIPKYLGSEQNANFPPKTSGSSSDEEGSENHSNTDRMPTKLSSGTGLGLDPSKHSNCSEVSTNFTGKESSGSQEESGSMEEVNDISNIDEDLSAKKNTNSLPKIPGSASDGEDSEKYPGVDSKDCEVLSDISHKKISHTREEPGNSKDVPNYSDGSKENASWPLEIRGNDVLASENDEMSTPPSSEGNAHLPEGLSTLKVAEDSANDSDNGKLPKRATSKETTPEGKVNNVVKSDDELNMAALQTNEASEGKVNSLDCPRSWRDVPDFVRDSSIAEVETDSSCEANPPHLDTETPSQCLPDTKLLGEISAVNTSSETPDSRSRQDFAGASETEAQYVDTNHSMECSGNLKGDAATILNAGDDASTSSQDAASSITVSSNAQDIVGILGNVTFDTSTDDSTHLALSESLDTTAQLTTESRLGGAAAVKGDDVRLERPITTENITLFDDAMSEQLTSSYNNETTSTSVGSHSTAIDQQLVQITLEHVQSNVNSRAASVLSDGEYSDGLNSAEKLATLPIRIPTEDSNDVNKEAGYSLQNIESPESPRNSEVHTTPSDATDEHREPLRHLNKDEPEGGLCQIY